MQPKVFLKPIGDQFVPFLKKLQGALNFLEKPLVFSSKLDEHCDKQHYFAAPEVDENKQVWNLHHCPVRDLAHLVAFQFTISSKLIFLSTVTCLKMKLVLCFWQQSLELIFSLSGTF